MYAVSSRSATPGHARQAAQRRHRVLAARAHGRYVVVVDEDIDSTNLKEVLWAMMTRVDPNTDIETVDGCWSTPLDTRHASGKRQARDHSNSRAIFYAVGPSAGATSSQGFSNERELFDQVVKKYGDVLPFPAR